MQSTNTAPIKTILTIGIIIALGTITGARADWCHKQGGGIEACNGAPSTWEECGKFTDGETIWCNQHATRNGSSGSKSKMTKTEAIILSAGIGVVVIMVAKYLLDKSPSQNNPGQISLMSF